MSSTTAAKRVLLLTNSEHGQANVFLAVSYALLTLEDEDVEVHFASFPAIRPFVSTTSEHAQRDKPGARPILFHSIGGIDIVSAWTRPEIVAQQAALNKRSSISLLNAIRRTLVLLQVTLPWTGPEFVQIMPSVAGITRSVQTDIIAVDPAFSPALTVLRHLKAHFIILSPNTIKDFAMPFQPNAEALWKYPCTGTNFPFLIPAHHLPSNTLLILLSLITSLFFDPRRRAVSQYLRTHYLANLPAIEFPLKRIPQHVLPCGPMLRPARPVAEADPELDAWLHRGGKTVYINLGTHVYFDDEGDGDMAAQMAGAVRVLLDRAREQGVDGIRVLWKIPRRRRRMDDEGKKGHGGAAFGRGEEVVRRILGEEVERDVVWVVDWVEAEPTAVLDSGTVACAVHHGGANSFLETVSAGVPQVVLPLWMDTFDFARRAEILEIGRWGNRLAGKLCESNELGSMLVDVVIGDRSPAYAQKARELAELCRSSGGGRAIAARHILAEIGHGKHE